MMSQNPWIIRADRLRASTVRNGAGADAVDCQDNLHRTDDAKQRYRCVTAIHSFILAVKRSVVHLALVGDSAGFPGCT